MKRNKLFLFISILTLALLFTISAICNQCTALQKEQGSATETIISEDTNSEATPAIKITDMSWNSNLAVIEVTLSEFTSWGEWTMYVDGKEIPMEGGAGKPVVRPNAALENSPTGLFIGTNPWITGLTNVDFPVCGTLQFDIPGKGLTNIYQFNLSGSGCKTASTKNCQVADASQGKKTQSTASSTKSTTAESTKESTQSTTTTTSTTTKQSITADIRPTDIYPDKQPNGIIFARITNNGPDTLNGSKVTVIVSGSKNDVSVASTENFITQPKEYFLTLKPGETQIINLEVDIDTSKYSYSFTMTVSPVDFTDPNNGNNSYTEKLEATQNQQGVSPQVAAADIVITDLFPKDTDWPTGELCIKVTNNGPGAIENKKIAITISGSQEDPLGNKANFVLVMEKFWVDSKIGSTITLKPGETKVIYPRDDNAGVLFFIYNYQYRYNFNLTINAVDFTDANENNNTYSKAIGKDKVVFSIINNTGAAIYIGATTPTISIYPPGQKNKGVNFLSNIPSDYGDSLKTGQTLYRLLDPGVYDMEISWSGGAGGPFLMYSQYGVNITSNYNWVLDQAVVVLAAPEDYPIWGFFYAPYLSGNWSSDLLSEIIPRWEYGIVKLQPGIWDWYVTTSNNETYYIGNPGKKFYGFDYIRIPEKWEIEDPWRRYSP